MWDANTINHTLIHYTQKLVPLDFNNPDGKVPADPQERIKIRNSNARDVGMFTANAIASNFPLAAQVVGTGTMIYGGCRVAFGLLGAGLGFCSTNANPALRKAASGLPLIAGGLATCFHVGTVPNALLAGLAAAELHATVTAPATETDERWPSATTSPYAENWATAPAASKAAVSPGTGEVVRVDFRRER